jgi:exopolysaccharide production protein ExoQ
MGNAMSLTTLLFLLAAFTKRRRNWLAWMGFSLSMTLNLLSRSASSLVNILTLISLTSLYQLIKQNYKLRVIIFGALCILVASINLLILNNLQIILVDILGKSLELNGRTPIWTLAIDKGLEKPWLGYGLNAFWSSDAGLYVMLHTWSGFREEGFNSHNSFLELFLNLGFLGILVYGITLITTFIKTLILLITTKKIEIFTFLELLVFMCIAGWSDTNFIMSAASSYCCIYVSIVLSIAMEWEKFSKELYSKKFLT